MPFALPSGTNCTGCRLLPLSPFLSPRGFAIALQEVPYQECHRFTTSQPLEVSMKVHEEEEEREIIPFPQACILNIPGIIKKIKNDCDFSWICARRKTGLSTVSELVCYKDIFF